MGVLYPLSKDGLTLVLGITIGVLVIVWLEREISAGIQQRIGPEYAGSLGILQALADGTKPLFKENILPSRGNTRLFSIGPSMYTIIVEYVRDIKNVADELAIAGAPIPDTYLVVKILSGIGPEYDSISAVIQARDSPISYNDLYDKLINIELLLTHRENTKSLSLITAAVAQRSSSGHNIFRDNRNNQSSNSQW
ncbi:hypothetical protein V6N11_010638 [Hibiscus sabdariffa]|uniref:Uncharacterized protein n=1 Tax=Hibiscus sabdariffa TaxID=183260 RepID=A0ABR2S5U8_9ROSI